MKAATDLMKSGKVMKSKRGQPSTFVDTFYNVKKKQGPTTLISEPSTKNDNVVYFPSFSKKLSLQIPNLRRVPKVLCEKCKVHLCFTPKSNCFYKFHV